MLCSKFELIPTSILQVTAILKNEPNTLPIQKIMNINNKLISIVLHLINELYLPPCPSNTPRKEHFPSKSVTIVITS